MNSIYAKRLKTVMLLLVMLLGFKTFAQEENGQQDFASDFFNEKPKKTNQNGAPPSDVSDMALSMLDSMNVFRANFGFTQIGDQNYIGFRLQPEIALGKIGVGLDIPMLFNLEDGKFRTEEFQRGVGALRLVRYVRYGVKKRDPLYAKVGDLTGTYLGYGILLNNYTNATSYERRKIGLNYDVRFGKYVGVEGVYSDFNATSFNLFAIRPYVRPFASTIIPIVRSLEIGASYVTDRDDTSELTADAEGNDLKIGKRFVNSGMSAWSADMGVTFLKIPFLTVLGSIQYAKLLKNDADSLGFFMEQSVMDENGDIATGHPLADGYQAGDGLSIGVNAKFNFIANIFNLEARIERLWYSDHFRPQFFNSLYEINKDERILSLGNMGSMQGIYGSLTATLLDKVRIGGSLLLPDDVNVQNPALVQVNAEAVNLFDKLILQGSYIKGDLTSLEDAFSFDERSLARVRVAYKFYKFLVVGTDYYWTFARLENGSYEITDHFTPYVGLNFPLNFGGAKTEN